MKLKKNFILRQVAGSWVVMPHSEATHDFHGLLALNDSGALLWQRLESGADKMSLVQALLNEFEVSEERASADVDIFLDKLAKAGCLEM